jgi:UDP-N-acetylmuramoyl-tripeptide--D-alanyl-D-alanine ligase
MSGLWSSSEAEAATGGRAQGSWEVQGISIDTRTVAPGDLFIALKGDNRDGHDFVADALAKGASAALVSSVPHGVAENAPLLIVDDTQAALEGLAHAARARSNARIIAVTGSAGKTTTKEMLRLMLGAQGRVAASAASYNNHWGVPLSLARMHRDTEFGVFEIGMNHEGEIRALVRQVRPHAVIITTIAPAHLEYFGKVEAIADAKAEIFEGLEQGGPAILPADNAQFGRLKDHAGKAGVAIVQSFGANGTDAKLVSTNPRGEGQNVVAEIGGEAMTISIGAPGAHIAGNALAALLGVRALGADLKKAASSLSGFTALKGRGERVRLGNIELIDESYNANPASMAVALSLLGGAAPGEGGRRIAVLGDMLELGDQAKALHAGLAKDFAAANADLAFLCGPLMGALNEALPARHRGAYTPTSAELSVALLKALRAGDVVLVKGSFGSRMSVIIDALKARAAATA